MIVIKSKREIELMREPCKVTAQLLKDLEAYIGLMFRGMFNTPQSL